ncbi:MAG: N-acetylmuramic acid 6-phosphate etherase [Ferruginibacter sp.]|nr:N-acetylmuramic acid 6-phosphate etherase [Ferruginibacter sp.]
MNQRKNTESPSHYDGLENKSVIQLITDINKEDQTIAQIVKGSLPQIEKLISAALPKMKAGGRLFYIGAGTSGRLGILDASEIPPTYGVGDNIVIGLIAGGDTAIRKAVEFAEDDTLQAWKDLSAFNINEQDFLVGIAASGETPYVLGGIRAAKAKGIGTGCIVCNPGSTIAKEVDYPVELTTGPEFVTGSTRMKAGTAQKMALNMISTSLMIRLGKVKGNKMIEMQLSNNKLWNRAVVMLTQELGITNENALALIKKHRSIKKAIKAFESIKTISP